MAVSHEVALRDELLRSRDHDIATLTIALREARAEIERLRQSNLKLQARLDLHLGGHRDHRSTLIAELRRLARDSRVSSEAIGMRVRNELSHDGVIDEQSTTETKS